MEYYINNNLNDITYMSELIQPSMHFDFGLSHYNTDCYIYLLTNADGLEGWI